MPVRSGRFAIFEQFLADGITHMFGNPGTVEQGFLDSLEQFPDFKYIMGLQETIPIAIGDAYARITKKPTLVQLHSGVGLGNGIGMMYQAYRGHAPLVIIAGESGVKYDAMDAQMAADLVAMARPVTKWSTRVVEPNSVLRVLRRAIKIAATPPMGPVFVALPADVLDAPNEEAVFPSLIPETRTVPETSLIQRAADLLGDARHPIIIMGDGIAYAGAQDELRLIAETLGAEVYGADSSEVNLSHAHPLYKGNLGHMFGASSSKITTKADAVLIVGTYVFPEVYPNLYNVFHEDAKIVHIDLNPYEIAKNFPVTLGLVADPKLTLAAINQALDTRMSSGDKETALARIFASRHANEEKHAQQIAHDAQIRGDVPMRPVAFMEALAQQLPQDAIIFDEALTTSPYLTRHLPRTEKDSFFQTRGGSLGVGIPGALGLKLARPDQTVIGFTGDGGSMYTIQALWTAARYNIGAKFVICNNQSYMLLKENIVQYWQDQVGVPVHKFPQGFDLDNPVVDFAALARSMGVPAVCVDHPDQCEAAVKQMLETPGPFLVDLVISNQYP
ncbi:MAG: thiamine pyrophosphate-binding protein [Chloroflexota bacterium]|nr:thiamine pyrophosphate-binding protein [Chloroflexota bacterium]